VRGVPGTQRFPCKFNFRIKWLLSHAQVHCDCAFLGRDVFPKKSRIARCPCAFRLHRLAQSARLGFVSFRGVDSLFLSYVHFVWQAWHFRDILRSKRSFCLTGAGHRALFHPCGRCDTFCTLLERWQAWIKMRGAFGGHFAWQA
jgi:hypothetical protein